MRTAPHPDRVTAPSESWGCLPGGSAARHSGLAVGGLVLVNDALARGFVEQTGGGAQGAGGLFGVTGVGGLAEAAYGRLELALDRLVAQAASLVGADALDLALDVGHAGLPRFSPESTVNASRSRGQTARRRRIPYAQGR